MQIEPKNMNGMQYIFITLKKEFQTVTCRYKKLYLSKVFLKTSCNIFFIQKFKEQDNRKDCNITSSLHPSDSKAQAQAQLNYIHDSDIDLTYVLYNWNLILIDPMDLPLCTTVGKFEQTCTATGVVTSTVIVTVKISEIFTAGKSTQ